MDRLSIQCRGNKGRNVKQSRVCTAMKHCENITPHPPTRAHPSLEAPSEHPAWLLHRYAQPQGAIAEAQVTLQHGMRRILLATSAEFQNPFKQGERAVTVLSELALSFGCKSRSRAGIVHLTAPPLAHTPAIMIHLILLGRRNHSSQGCICCW